MKSQIAVLGEWQCLYETLMLRVNMKKIQQANRVEYSKFKWKIMS